MVVAVGATGVTVGGAGVAVGSGSRVGVGRAVAVMMDADGALGWPQPVMAKLAPINREVNNPMVLWLVTSLLNDI